MRTTFLRAAGLARLLAAALLLAACGDGTGSDPNPTPGVDALNPQSVMQRSGAFTLTVTGSDFVRGSVVRWNGTDRPTTYVSATQLTAAVPAADVEQAAVVQVSVFNPAPGGGASGTMPLEVRVALNPSPLLNGINPASLVAGTGGEVTLLGSGFVATSTVWLGNQPLQPTYVSATELRLAVTAAMVPSGGQLQVVVSNPFPGGGTSVPRVLQVLNPAPTLTALSPSTSAAGQDSLVLRVTGTGFTASSAIQVSGGARTTRFVSATELETTLTADDVSGAGTHNVAVASPAPGGGTSAALPLTLTQPVPVLAALPSYGASAGRPGFPLRVHGTGFVRASVVRWNGAERTTRYISNTRLEINVTAADVAAPGTASLTVHTPGAGTSDAAALTVRAVPGMAVTGYRAVPLAANAVVWDRHSGRLYASIPGQSSQHPNSVVAIDPATGAVTASVGVGSEPGALSISDDGTTLWVALDGSGDVRRLALPSLTPGLAFSLGADRVEEMHVMPGRPGTLAISHRNTCCSPRHLGVAVHDDGVRRARATPGHTGSNTIAWGEGGRVLYGYNNESTEFGFRTIQVAADGLAEARLTRSVLGEW
ncbi:MAG TPA: IPT/TIG domain-containing protein, partial [Longimicrobium sp.]|nr:IPT/TIG domain-containing protein [Longimicrobium sp.]